ncbi:hypothetical protein H4R35_004305 [Dimargaris xerosporica]|nr:hypothetical protein H4R35_004305 [Dimargaris xerosporica]
MAHVSNVSSNALTHNSSGRLGSKSYVGQSRPTTGRHHARTARSVSAGPRAMCTSSDDSSPPVSHLPSLTQTITRSVPPSAIPTSVVANHKPSSSSRERNSSASSTKSGHSKRSKSSAHTGIPAVRQPRSRSTPKIAIPSKGFDLVGPNANAAHANIVPSIPLVAPPPIGIPDGRYIPRRPSELHLSPGGAAFGAGSPESAHSLATPTRSMTHSTTRHRGQSATSTSTTCWRKASAASVKASPSPLRTKKSQSRLKSPVSPPHSQPDPEYVPRDPWLEGIADPFAKRDKIPRDTLEASNSQPSTATLILTPPVSHSNARSSPIHSNKSVPTTPKGIRAAKRVPPAEATPPKHTSIDFSAIADPFKKRDKIPMESPEDQQGLHQHPLLAGVAGLRAKSPESPLRRLPDEGATTLPEASTPSKSPRVKDTRAPSPLPPTSIGPMLPSLSTNPSIPTPFQKRDKIPLHSAESMERLRQRTQLSEDVETTSTQQEPASDALACSSLSSGSQDLAALTDQCSQPLAKLHGVSSPKSSSAADSPLPLTPEPLRESPELIPYDDILIPTVYKRIRRQGESAIAALDEDMQRKYYLTDKWYLQQKKLSPLMESSYRLYDDGRSSTIGSPQSQAANGAPPMAETLSLNAQSPSEPPLTDIGSTRSQSRQTSGAFMASPAPTQTWHSLSSLPAPLADPIEPHTHHNTTMASACSPTHPPAAVHYPDSTPMASLYASPDVYASNDKDIPPKSAWCVKVCCIIM